MQGDPGAFDRCEPDGSFRLNLDYFSMHRLDDDRSRFDAMFGGAPRRPDQPLEQRPHGSAASIQAVRKRSCRPDAFARAKPGSHLCLAGALALNCVAMARCFATAASTRFRATGGDAGGAPARRLAVSHAENPLSDRGRHAKAGFYGKAHISGRLRTK